MTPEEQIEHDYLVEWIAATIATSDHGQRLFKAEVSDVYRDNARALMNEFNIEPKGKP